MKHFFQKQHVMCIIYALSLCLFASVSMAADYVIGEGDVLDIAVWGVKELTFSVKVRPDGKITVPGLGDVVASGYTPTDLQKLLKDKLKELVRDPIVTTTVKEITNSKVYIFGGGIKAGVYDLSRRTSLLQLLCSLGETKTADLRRSYLLRSGKKVKTDMHRLFIDGDVTQDIQVESGDSLFIPLLHDKNVYVLGAVNMPKAIEYREGMSVMEAILESGGFTKFASQNNTIIRRKEGDKEISIPVRAKDLIKEGDMSQNIRLKAGDYIIITEGIF